MRVFILDLVVPPSAGSAERNYARIKPTDLDRGQWARVLKDAGAKMAILTAKHEDDLFLWPSEYTRYGFD